MSALRCRHGEWSDTGRTRDLPDSVEGRARRHERRCGGEVFVHKGTLLGLLDVACCTGCRGQVS